MTAPVTIAESTAGPNFAAASSESVLAIIGCAAGGVAVDTPKVCRNDAQPAESFVAGPLVAVSKISIGAGRQPAVLVRATTATAAAYGSIDDDDFTGTAIAGVDSATVPYDAYEAYVEFEVGGTLGTSGITYRTSLDTDEDAASPRTLSGLSALGTDDSITIAEGNVKFTLRHTGLFTLVDECVDDYLAHIADAVSHNPADTANTVSTSPVTTLAESRTKATAIKTAALAHFANTGGSYHDVADTVVAVAALTALALPTTGATDISFWNGFKAIFNAHRTQATIHPTNDTTNVVAASDAVVGTVVAGDILRVATTAPLFDATGLAAALAVLPTYQGLKFGGICVAGALTSSQMWSAIVTALDDLEEQQRPCSALVEMRLPTAGETSAQYRTAMEVINAAYARDNRITRVAGDLRLYPTEIRQCSQQFRRSALALAAARHVSLRYEQSHALVDPVGRPTGSTPSTYGGPLKGGRIYDDDAAPIGHDEAANPGLSDLLFMTTTTYPQEGSSAFLTEPKTAAPDNDTVYTLPIRRIVNVAKRLIYFRLTRLVQSLVLREPGTTMMTEKAANDINTLVLADLRGELKGRVSDVTFEVDRVGSDVSVTSPRVLWNASITTGGYIAGFDGTVSVNQ